MDKKKRTFWIIVAALGIVIITMPTALAGSELIINGGFESGDATGWTLIGSSVTSNDKYSGTYSVNFHYAAASASQEFSPAVSTSGDLTFWVKCICIYDCSMLVSVRYNDGSFSKEIISLSRDTWQQITYSIDNSKQLERVFFHSGAKLYIDDVSLKSLQDSDGDGIPDAQDACPNEDSTGFDVDGDGCIDTLNSLNQLIPTLPNDVLSDETKNSLVSKVENAQKSTDKNADNAAINQLNAFINEVKAQRGNKISENVADMLIKYAQNIIAQIEAG